ALAAAPTTLTSSLHAVFPIYTPAPDPPALRNPHPLHPGHRHHPSPPRTLPPHHHRPRPDPPRHRERPGLLDGIHPIPPQMARQLHRTRTRLNSSHVSTSYALS